jgi:hypothetical protein
MLQFNCTTMGGYTEGRKLASLCELNHGAVERSQLSAGMPCGEALVRVFSIYALP